MRIMVIGDSCLDRHVYGKCSRLCPEAPVPVFTPITIHENGGMAANVYANIVAIGNVDVYIEDEHVTLELVSQHSQIIKTRYVDEHTNQMFLRIDEDSGCTRIRLKEDFIFRFFAFNPDVIVISDYNKGFLHEDDITLIAIEAKKKNIPVFMDTKKMLSHWANLVTYIKFNSKEYSNNKQVIDQIEGMKEKVIVTCGPNGCVFNGKKYPVLSVDVKDLSGAGDTFLAGLVVEYMKSDGDIDKAIKFANECATLVVQKRGVCTI